MAAHMIRRAQLLAALTILSACSDPPGPDSSPSAALVSPSIVPPGAKPSATVAAGQAYVSMPPETDANGRRVEILNLRNGASVISAMLDGGFDPVAVMAEAEDSLSITVVHHDGSQATTYSVVPRRSRPKVVRTSPRNGRTDIPLNSVIVVVFNQPMDSASLPGALQLRLNGSEVPGIVSGTATGGVILDGRFTPTNPLAPRSSYQLLISTGAQSQNGDSLDAALSVRFTTQSSAGLVRFRVVHVEAGVGDMDVLFDGDEVVSDLPYLATTSYLDLTSGSHVISYRVDPGTMDQTRWNFPPGTYTAIPCCRLFPLGGFLLQDDNSEPAAGQARIRVVDFADLSTSVKVYITAPGAELNTVEPIGINVTWNTGYLEIPAGDYQVRVTPFDSDVVGIDSGTLTLLAGQARTLVAVNSLDDGPPYDFLVLPDRN